MEASTEDLFKMAGFSGSGVAIVLLAYKLFKSVQGRKCVSDCCGHRASVGFKTEAMSSGKIAETPRVDDEEKGQHPLSQISSVVPPELHLKRQTAEGIVTELRSADIGLSIELQNSQLQSSTASKSSL